MDCIILFSCESYRQAVAVDSVLSRCQASDALRTTVCILLELIMLRNNVMFLLNSRFNR